MIANPPGRLTEDGDIRHYGYVIRRKKGSTY